MTDPKPTSSPQFAGKRWRGGASPVRRAYKADMRYRPARRLKTLTDSLVAQLGRGPLDSLDELTRTRVAMCAHFMLIAEQAVADAARGRPSDPEAAVRVSNSLSRLLADLELDAPGQERRREREAAAAHQATLDTIRQRELDRIAARKP